MKHTISIIFSLFLLCIISGCAPANTKPNDKLSVVCTIFPQYDWTRRILGDNADEIDLTLISDNGVDLHSFQPSVDDIVKLSTCDLFIYVGGESDEWVEDAIKQAANPNMLVIDLLDILGDAAKSEDIVEGMEDDAEHEHGEDELLDEGGHEESAYDEHVWLSLKNAEIFSSAIAEALSSLDADNAEEYKNNLAEYSDELRALDTKYRQVTTSATVKTLLFGDRFPFRYLVDDYGLDYYAAFPGCSAETEASFSTIIFLAGKINELNLNSIMVTESSDASIAKTIIENTDTKDQQIHILNSLQSVKSADIESGQNYLSVMEENLNTLAEALK